MKSFQVRVTKDHLVFSAGHFITYAGGLCERLHGHNYRVAAEVAGKLDENHYVFDFVELYERLRGIVDELDHRMLLPGESPLIRLVEDGPNVGVRFMDRRWSFPRDECVILPIANTTAELLADYIAGRLLEGLRDSAAGTPEVLRIDVEENFGQWARVERIAAADA